MKDIEATRRAWADSGFAVGLALRDYDDLLPDTAENLVHQGSVRFELNVMLLLALLRI